MVIGPLMPLILEVGKKLLGVVSHRIRYLVHYKKNAENLNAEVERLEVLRKDNQESVRAAEINGEEIKAEVHVWLKRADAAIVKLSRKAVKDAVTIRELQASGRFERAMNEVMQALRMIKLTSSGSMEWGASAKQPWWNKYVAVKLEEESEAGRAGHLKESLRIEIILTTRLENVCHTMESQAKVPLHILSEQDSWRLFRKKAGNAIDSPDFHDVAWKVVKECGGLPIALVVVARALGTRTWKNGKRLLDNLKCLILQKMIMIILFSDDTNINIEDLVKYGVGQGLFQNANSVEEAKTAASSLLKHLKACSLLLNSDQEGCVKMHDVVRDTAISIASAGDEHAFLVHSGAALKKWPRKDGYEAYTAISLMSNEIQELPDGLDGISKGLGCERRGYLITTLVTWLLLNLRTLCLDECKSTDLSILGELRKLEILSLRESCIEDLSQLEEIYLQGSFGDWGKPIEGKDQETNAGFDELTRLPCLNTLKVDISDAGCIPQTVASNPNWVKFNICMSEDLFVRLMDVHLSKIMAARSRALILNTNYQYLARLYDQGRLNGLKSLLVESCYGIVQLMNTDIRVSNRPVEQCDKLVGPLLQPNLLQRLENLEVLDVRWNSLEDIFRSEGLRKEQILLRKLREMKLDKMRQLKNIWNGPAQLAIFNSSRF
ncbi:putative disease resistance protein [Vitis vinifera]|uniref:Putative disease resistance protein n=1 Tax=Vitis vinifera TaxID=29760 RepID=A0A438GUQ9_VITVI|nr:putative disease resistance protein [Vitis vinifera]